MSESQDSKPILETQDGVFVKTSRLMVNLVTNILMCFTVSICIVYACSTETMTMFHWHIILCVFGYQFCMSQGILLLSRYNSWSMHLSRRSRKNLHIAFQLAGFILVVAGSSVIACEKTTHFQTIHGSLGLSSVITSFISIINGVLANYAYKLSRSYVLCIKYIHFFSGVVTLFLSAGSLSVGFEVKSFRVWLANDDALVVLMFVTWLFTLLIALDFWIVIGKRLLKLF